MAEKVYFIEGIGDVSVFKRRGTKKFSLRITSGKVKVTQPTWVPFSSGLQFAKANLAWIIKQLGVRNDNPLQNNHAIGKQHTLVYKPGSSLRSRVGDNIVSISIPPGLSVISPAVQKLAKDASARALKKEAEDILASRIELLANHYNLHYSGVHFKKLKTRWGSCNNKHFITLNVYLLMLPQELIDYVILHELAHTKFLNHSKDYWDLMAKILPDYKARRKELKRLQQSAMVLS
jgi:predicted metal-dependent hydrolase